MLRPKLHSIRSVVLFAIFSICCATPQSAIGGTTIIDRLEASVNSSIIFLSDLRTFRKTVKLRAQMDPLFAGTKIASQGEKATDQEIVGFLIDEKLITQAFPVSDRETEDEISTIQSNNHIDAATLKQTLGEQGFRYEDYFELIRTSASKRNLIDRDIRTKVSISDEDVKNYYYHHVTRSTSDPFSYRLQMIFIPTADYKTPAAAREFAQKALDEIKKGEAFEEVAKRVSGGPNASSGGDLGTVAEDQLAPLVREQVKKLQIGQISEIFGGPAAGGFTILRLIDIKSGGTEKFEKEKEGIRGKLTAAEYQHQIQLWIERQRQSAFIHVIGAPVVAGIPASQKAEQK